MRLDDDGFLMSLSLQESDSVVFSKRWAGALSYLNIKKLSQDNLHMPGSNF